MMTDSFSPDNALAFLNAQSAQTTKAPETLKQNTDAKRLKELDAASEDFEAVFLAEMIKPMFETLNVDPMFGGGKGEEVFRSFLVQEYGKILAGTGTVGISQEVKEMLLNLQEGGTGTGFAKLTTDPNSEE